MRMTHEGRRILGFWMAAVVAGSLLALAIRLALLPILIDQVHLHATSANTLDWGFLAVRVAVTLVAAVIVAGPQAYVLGRRLSGIEIPWIEAGVVATLVAFALPVETWIVNRTGLLMGAMPQPSLLGPLASGLEFGLLAGLAQAFVLRDYVRGAAWWVAASVAAYAIANMALSLVDWQIAGGAVRATLAGDVYAEGLVGPILGYAIVAIATGLTLVWLLGESKPELTEAAT
jgi:hypothetical protein